MNDQARDPRGDDTAKTAAIQWRAHPARQRPGAAALAILIIAAVAAAAWLSFGWPWAALCAVVMSLSINRFLLASRFSIDAEGITARHPMRTQRLRWRDVRRFVHDDRGGFVSTRARPGRLDAFPMGGGAGMHVIWGAEREAAIRSIRAYVGAARPSESGLATGADAGARA